MMSRTMEWWKSVFFLVYGQLPSKWTENKFVEADKGLKAAIYRWNYQT